MPRVDEGDRLRWVCRRGMLELDALLQGFLDTTYEQAAPDLRRAFAALVECDDMEIVDLLAGRSEPPGPAMSRLVALLARNP